MPIERTQVGLADKCFHESTIDALKYFSKETPSWNETASFLSIIRHFFNVVNVKSCLTNILKRDDRKKPVTKSGEQQEFLLKFADWLHRWEKEGQKGRCLSAETSLAAQQTCTALAALCDYLLENGFDYVLLGKINSDPLEKKFGWYWQLSGANYFMSCRQFFEAEKKIRLQCLVKYGNITFQEIRNIMMEDPKIKETEIAIKVQKIVSLCTFEFGSSVCKQSGYEGIIFFIAGYIGRSLVKQAKKKKVTCTSCIKQLLKS